MSSYIIIVIFLIVILIGLINKVNCYDCFIIGAKEGLSTTVNMFSYLLTFFIALSLFNSSGLIEYISNIFNSNYLPIIIQMIIRPLSSSSSLSLMMNAYQSYGIDNDISVLSTLIHYISDSTLYIVPFYCGIINVKKYNKIIILGLIINIFSYILVTIVSLLFL